LKKFKYAMEKIPLNLRLSGDVAGLHDNRSGDR